MIAERVELSELPPIPDRVRLYPFHRPFAAMATGGPLPDDTPVKSIETRGRPWGGLRPRPAWVAVYATERVTGLQPEALQELSRVATPEQYERYRADHSSYVVGLLYITSSRPLTREDMPRAFFWAEGRHAWLIGAAVRFLQPFRRHVLGVTSPPQGFVYVPGAPLRAAAGLAHRYPTM